MKYIVYADGGARGNPGPAGAGAIVRNEEGKTVLKVSEFLGHTTNNVAEYTAVLRALEGIRDIAGAENAEVHVHMDSELVVKQMKGEYKIKHPNLKPLAEQVKMLIRSTRTSPSRMCVGNRTRTQMHSPTRRWTRAAELQLSIKSTFDLLPVDVLQEGFNVAFLFSWHVIDHKSMLPQVQCEHYW